MSQEIRQPIWFVLSLTIGGCSASIVFSLKFDFFVVWHKWDPLVVVLTGVGGSVFSGAPAVLGGFGEAIWCWLFLQGADRGHTGDCGVWLYFDLYGSVAEQGSILVH
jgi:hypothetical protein